MLVFLSILGFASLMSIAWLFYLGLKAPFLDEEESED
jgi:hypothetical protein